MPSCDILGLGCLAVDHCLLVEEFPREDGKVAVLARRQSLGGTAGGALAAASRFGVSCAYAGRLDRCQAAWVVAELEHHGVNTDLVRHAEGALPIHSHIVVSRKLGSRTVLFDLAGTAPAAADWPPEESIRGSRALLLDHYGMEGMLRAARIARSAGIPIVADFEAHQRPEFAELAACVDHLIVSLAFASAATGMDDPAAVCRALWSDCRQAVVVTCGAAGCWYLAARQRRPEHLPAFRVAAIDTTGCGDTFRGVYAAALAAGMSLTERLQRAAAAAAIVASCPFEDATTRFPDRCQIEAFLAQRAA